jgi:hypothetical protein
MKEPMTDARRKQLYRIKKRKRRNYSLDRTGQKRTYA